MTGHPLAVFMQHDPQLMELVNQSRELTFADGALSKKHKLLIALALDAAHGAVNGVRSLAQQALAAGATKEEILEAVHVTHYISGVGSVYTSAQGLQDLFATEPDSH